MPELPEVETTVRAISKFQNKLLKEIIVHNANLRWKVDKNISQLSKNKLIKEISRRAKYILIHFNDSSLMIHLGMSGKLRIQNIGNNFFKKHDHIEIIPGRKPGVVRSLQVMDDDVNEAGSGDRVGVALRGVHEDDIGKGSVIVIKESDVLQEVTSTVSKLNDAPFQRRRVMIGDIVHASTNMQFKVGRVIAIQGSMISIEWESPLVIRKDGRGVVILVQLDAVPMRILGSITETSSA